MINLGRKIVALGILVVAVYFVFKVVLFGGLVLTAGAELHRQNGGMTTGATKEYSCWNPTHMNYTARC